MINYILQVFYFDYCPKVLNLLTKIILKFGLTFSKNFANLLNFKGFFRLKPGWMQLAGRVLKMQLLMQLFWNTHMNHDTNNWVTLHMWMLKVSDNFQLQTSKVTDKLNASWFLFYNFFVKREVYCYFTMIKCCYKGNNSLTILLFTILIEH